MLAPPAPAASASEHARATCSMSSMLPREDLRSAKCCCSRRLWALIALSSLSWWAATLAALASSRTFFQSAFVLRRSVCTFSCLGVPTSASTSSGCGPVCCALLASCVSGGGGQSVNDWCGTRAQRDKPARCLPSHLPCAHASQTACGTGSLPRQGCLHQMIHHRTPKDCLRHPQVAPSGAGHACVLQPPRHSCWMHSDAMVACSQRLAAAVVVATTRLHTLPSVDSVMLVSHTQLQYNAATSLLPAVACFARVTEVVGGWLWLQLAKKMRFSSQGLILVYCATHTKLNLVRLVHHAAWPYKCRCLL